MSKYIRTKDGVYEVKRIFNVADGTIYVCSDTLSFRSDDIDIINQADTIEELCDEFVYVDTKNNIELYKYMLRKSLCDNDKKYMKMGTEIYGAIWTSKGLIYVAKMNEDGELVLI